MAYTVLKIVVIVLCSIQLVWNIYSTIMYLVKNKGLKGSELVGSLLAVIPKLVTKAEEIFGSGKGEAKLDWVVQGLRMIALEQGMKVDTETLVNAVNDVVETTKKVNVVKKVEEVNE